MVGWGGKVYAPTGSGASANQASDVTILHLLCVNANTEYSIAIPDGTQIMSIIDSELKSRLRIAFEATQTNTAYTTIHLGNSWDKYGLSLTGKTLYVQANKPNITVEIECWV